MAAYYNENDAKKAAVLRELIKWGLIAPGEVDERSIEDVRPNELAGFRQCHFFAGAGIWSYALRLAGWPDDRPVWTGSCPCPSFSAAGKGEGFEDARHLWPAWYRLIRECRPATIFGEQVEAAIGFGWIDLVQFELEASAYSVGKIVLGACSVGAPHIRQRVFFVADSGSERVRGDALSGSDARRTPRLSEHGYESREELGWGPSSVNGARVGARSELSVGSDSNGRDTNTEGLQRSGKHRLRTEDGCSTWLEGDDERPKVDNMLNPNSARPFQGRQTGETTGHRGSTEPASSVGDGSESECEGLEGHFGDVRDWRGPGWLDPIAARSVAEAGATRGFWADCDWWYGRDGKYRPIGPRLFPLAHRAPARVVRLRCYGDGIVPQVAQAFIESYLEAYMETC